MQRLGQAQCWQSCLIALGLGALTVAGFAPFYVAWLPWLTLALLFAMLQQLRTPKQVLLCAFSFGLGLYGVGIYWIYISLHTFGGMPWWFAGFCTAALCAFMALFPALAAYGAARSRLLLGVVPIYWALSDWVRSWIFTGFPWLTLGYSQAPDSPLAGFFAILGVYGVSALTAATAALIAAAMLSAVHRMRCVLAALVLLCLGQILSDWPWSRPVHAPISVALLQGNINQSIKWSSEHAETTLQQYLNMVRQTSAQLIVLPETALPILVEQMDPAYMAALRQHAVAHQADILLGVIDAKQGNYYNSAISIGQSPTQTYAKSHLVPFGEYIPLKAAFGWIYRDWLHMPLSDLARGTSKAPLHIAGQQVGVNICYEDVFGEEITQQLPAAELLVNLSNDAWYGQSFAADQHLQFSQVRAIETARMVLRSTNTGATAIIDPHGQVLQHAPHDTATILVGEAQSYAGQTPYVWWGNLAFLCLSGVWLGGLLVNNRRK